MYVPIAYAPQESFGVMNALVITLHALKTIFQHLAEFSQKNEKIGSQEPSIAWELPRISVIK